MKHTWNLSDLELPIALAYDAVERHLEEIETGSDDVEMDHHGDCENCNRVRVVSHAREALRKFREVFRP